MELNIEGMLSPTEAAAKNAESQVKIESLLESVRSQSEAILEQQLNTPQFIGKSGKTAGMIMQEEQAKLQAQNQARAVASAADWENMAVQQGQELRSTMQQKQQVTEKIVQDSSVSFWDDPLTALMNEFTLPWDQQKLSAIEQREQTLKLTMDNAHNHVQQSAKTADVIKESITAGTLAEQAAALAGYQKQMDAAARINYAEVGIKNLDKVRAMNNDASNLYLKEVQLRNGEEQMAMARSREDRQMQLLDKQLAEVKDKEEVDSTYLGYINRALQAEGKTPLDIKKFKYYKQTSAEMLDTLARQGMSLTINGPDSYTYGATIQDRIKVMNTIGFQPKTKQQENIVVEQVESYDAYAKANPQITDKKLIVEGANKLFAANFRKGQNNIKEGSPFAAPAFSVYATTSIAQNPVWQKYVAPTLTETSANNPVTPEFILSVVKQASLDKEIGAAAAAEFGSQVFKRAVALNNEVHQFKKITGLRQDTYGVRMTISPGFAGFFKDVKNLNLTDTAVWNSMTAHGIAGEIMASKLGADVAAARTALASTALARTANITGADLYGRARPITATGVRNWMGLPSATGVK